MDVLFYSLSAIIVNYSDRNIEYMHLTRHFKSESLQVEPSGAPGHKNHLTIKPTVPRTKTHKHNFEHVQTKIDTDFSDLSCRDSSGADPENFVRGGPTLVFFVCFFRGSKYQAIVLGL